MAGLRHNSCSFHVHNILPILNVVSIFVNNRKFVEQNVHREGVLIGKSYNIVLFQSSLVVTHFKVND